MCKGEPVGTLRSLAVLRAACAEGGIMMARHVA